MFIVQMFTIIKCVCLASVGILLVTKSHCSCLVLPVLGNVLIVEDYRRFVEDYHGLSRIIEDLSRIIEDLKTVILVGQ